MQKHVAIIIHSSFQFPIPITLIFITNLYITILTLNPIIIIVLNHITARPNPHPLFLLTCVRVINATNIRACIISRLIIISHTITPIHKLISNTGAKITVVIHDI